MNFSGLTGMLLCAAAVLWVAFLIPSWTKATSRTQEVRDAKAQAVAQIKQANKPSNSQVTMAYQAMRLKRTRIFLGFTMVASLAAIGYGISSMASLWQVALGGLLTFGISVTANRAASKRYYLLLQQNAQAKSRRPMSFSNLVDQAKALDPVAVPLEDDRSWTPSTLPAPIHTGHIGSLEEPILAQVTELVVQARQIADPTEALVGANLDEILRRRRAI
jgi:hypothetical protein